MADMGFSDVLQLVGGPLLAIAGFVSGIWYKVENKIDNVRKDCSVEIASARRKIENTERELNEFRLKVAEEYASWETVKSIEARLTERMDTLSESVAKMPDAVVDRIMKFMSLHLEK